jgi:hypothetical protein
MPTTSGFVQSYFVGAGPLACAWIGPAPDDTELIFTTTMTGLLAQAQVTGQQVDVVHPDDSGEASSISTTPCDLSANPLHLDGIEVTQAIQDLSQSVPLISGKRTVVRAYLGNHTAATMTVQGQLTIRQAPTDPVTVISAEADAVLDPAHAGDIPAQRNQLGRSLDFVLPDTATAEGPLVVELTSVTDQATGASVAVGCPRQPTVWFHRGPPLRMRLLGVRYTQNGVTHVPRDVDFDFLVSWLRRAYPVAQVVESRTFITATAAPPFSALTDIDPQLAAIRALDVDSGEDNRTHYYGLVSDGGFFMRGFAAGVPATPDPSVVASGPAGDDTWGWDFDGSYADWYGAHEIGHTFGRKHPGFCGETQSDLLGYPFAGGTLADHDDSFCGYDVGDPVLGLPRQVLPGLDWHDVMTYCPQEWVSPYTYQGIRLRLLEEDALGSAPLAGLAPSFASAPAVVSVPAGRPDQRVGVAGTAPQPLPRTVAPPDDDGAAPAEQSGAGSALSVVATVNLTRSTARIAYVHPLSNSVPTPADPDSPYALRLLRADGAVLAETRVPVKPAPIEDQAADRGGMVDAVLALPPGAAAVELRLGDRTLDTYRAAGAAGEEPSRSVISAVSGRDIVLDLGREARPGTSYVVQVSDDGRRWRTVGVGLRSPRVPIDRAEARGRGSLRVRVTVTDGFTSTVIAEDVVRA